MSTVTVTPGSDTQLDAGTAALVVVVNTSSGFSALVKPWGRKLRPGERGEFIPDQTSTTPITATGVDGSVTLTVTTTAKVTNDVGDLAANAIPASGFTGTADLSGATVTLPSTQPLSEAQAVAVDASAKILGAPYFETRTPMSANAVFTGTPHDMQPNGPLPSQVLSVAALADQSFTLAVEGSADGLTSWSTLQSGASTTSGSSQVASLAVPASVRYLRVKLTNGSTGMTTLICASAQGMAGAQGQAGAAGAAGTATAPDIQIFTASGTWTKPGGSPRLTRVRVIGGGPGAGSGRRGAAGSVRCGGGGGGSPGITDVTLRTSDLPGTVSVAIGAGGAGGAAVTADDTNGNAGTAGGATTFGAYARSAGGSAGAAGTATTGTGGNPGGGMFSGVSGASASTSGAVGNAGSTGTVTAGGGGSGGGITTGNAASNGGAGGLASNIDNTQTTGGVVDTTEPTTAVAAAAAGLPGQAGAGGASSVTTAAQTGGAGGNYGAPGGGGGASVNGNNSGAGGPGPGGYCIAITTF